MLGIQTGFSQEVHFSQFDAAHCILTLHFQDLWNVITDLFHFSKDN
jgi:hypothetical protein